MTERKMGKRGGVGKRERRARSVGDQIKKDVHCFAYYAWEIPLVEDIPVPCMTIALIII